MIISGVRRESEGEETGEARREKGMRGKGEHTVRTPWPTPQPRLTCPRLTWSSCLGGAGMPVAS